MWIELLGFELDDADYGVGRLCDRAGFIPDGVSLLLSDPEFVHGHSADDARILSPSICSYGGHPYNEERSLQQWSAGQLKGLIAALHARGIKVFYTHFDAPVDGWVAEHPEILFINRKGERIDFISPYKRLAGGEYYRDFYLPLMVATVRDFGFDGFHAGDGFAHPRIPLYEGDFSDDTVAQYLEWSGGGLSQLLGKNAEGNARVFAQRAEWLWREHRLSWIEFQRHRTLQFWSQAAELLHAEGKQLFLNSCWTRDPFEALYRYGVDYSALVQSGVDGFFAETAAAAHEYGGDLPYREDGHDQWDPSRVLSRFSTKLMLLRAAAPEAGIVFMNGIKDTNEAWAGIRHAPVNLESEILTYTGLFQVREEGRLQPSSSGLIATLSDGLAVHEWEWLRARWELGYSLHPQRLLGAAIYWSDVYPGKLVEDYCATRRSPFDRIVWKMTVAGAPILATVRPENLEGWSGPLLVVHPHLLPEEEWTRIMRWTGGPVIAVGGRRASSEQPVFGLAESHGEDALELAIYGCSGEAPVPPCLPPAEPFDAALADDPYQWLDDLPARVVSPDFFRYAAEWVIALSRGVRVLKNQDDIRAWGYETGENRLRIHVRNDGFYYRSVVIDIGRLPETIKTLTASPGNPVHVSGSVFRFKLAGKSMAIFDVAIAGPVASCIAVSH